MAKQDDQLNVRVPHDLKEWLRAQAAKEERSMNFLAVKLMEQGRQLQEAQQ